MSEEANLLYLLGALAFGYLLGSIPFGLIFTRMAGLGDIRNVGSGNIGATNVLRTGNKGIAIATLLGDVLKGTVPVLIAAQWGGQFATLAALGAFLGHLFPVWLKFKGGKGVATFIGVLIGLNWIVALIFCAIWLGVAFASRYSSLSSLTASAATPIVLWLLGQPAMAAMTVMLVALLWWKHSANISRLLAGNESKIGQKG
ncbi:glycerol-3-phosphate 1-O-acyltransferase PlsY [Microvirga sp. ACRRW]|uniref:glycerol-3-phosphate 1-O-acyltransferase PlsY n=1 Tax=Microvirga sp. ACRRW TaxID=2918205 RepID=UPI001EF724B2|nr:glycerol-3-phosphate 1-O-acyltransferase PlsY [Microvirga sp. ACRRW]MCG7394009.1 glycerol-3-phosphate 1-O-acyltransferase PlsY [Microvirga sp. ACRRW]